MSWPGRIALTGIVLVFFFALGLEPLLGPLLYTLTPLQRQYLPAYIASSWHKNDPAAVTEVHWVLKLQPRKPEPKPEPKSRHERGSKEKTDALPRLDEAFASERDVVLKPMTDRIWAGNALPFSLSQEAAREGWTGLEWSYRQQMKSAELDAMLRDSFFDGRPWIGFFVQPAIALFSFLVLLVFGRTAVEAWHERHFWGPPLRRREYLWRWMYEPPVRVMQAPERAAPLTLAAPTSSSPHRLQAPVAQQEMAPKPAVPKPSVAVQSTPNPPPAAPEKREQAYLWDETAGLD